MRRRSFTTDKKSPAVVGQKASGAIKRLKTAKNATVAPKAETASKPTTATLGNKVDAKA
jgi:hypothetical protein